MDLKNKMAVELITKFFRGFSDPCRLSILQMLQERPRTVTELTQGLGLTQPTVSNHLSCLRECGLVKSTQQGRFVTYELSDNRISKLIGLASELLSDAAAGVYLCTRYDCEASKSQGSTEPKKKAARMPSKKAQISVRN